MAAGRALGDVVPKGFKQRFNISEGVGAIGGAFEPGERIGGDERVAAEARVGGGAVEEDDVREMREALKRFDRGERCGERFDEGQGKVSDHDSALESVAPLSRAGERRR